MLLKFLFKFFNKMEVPWLDHWQLQGRNTPMKDRFPRLHPFVLDDMLTVKASMIYHPWSVTCTTLSPLKPIMSWFNWSPFCHWYLSMLRARTFSTDQPKLVNFDPRYIITLLIATLLWIQLLSVYGSVHARSRSKSLVGYYWWIGLTQEIWCKAYIGLCKMILVFFARLSHMRIEHICSLFLTSASWKYLGITWASQPNQSTYLMAAVARKGFHRPFFIEVVFTATCNIWTRRNGKIFKNERPSFGAWTRNFVHYLSLLAHRNKCKYRDSLLSWISSLP